MKIDKYFHLWADKNTVHFDEVAPFENRQKGNWIETKRNVMGEGFMWKCSVCANEVYVSSKGDFPNYCDECGADMRTKAESE